MSARRIALIMLLLNGSLMAATAWRVAELRREATVQRLAVQQRWQRPPEWSSSHGPR